MKDDVKHGRRPCHPGEILREDCLPELKMTADQLADAGGVPREEMSLFVNEKISVSPSMAQCLAAKVGSCATFWLALQDCYDNWGPTRLST